MKCPHCGYENSGTLLTCKLCGERLREPTAPSPGRPRGAASGGQTIALAAEEIEAYKASTDATPSSGFLTPQRTAPKASEVSEAFILCPPLEPLRLAEGATTTIGRSPTCTLTLSSHLVSRKHALIEWRGGRFVLTDCGSVNGTLLKGKRVQANRPIRLYHGDKISIGPFLLRFVLGTESDIQEMDKKEAKKTGRSNTKQATGRFVTGMLKDRSLRELITELGEQNANGTLTLKIEGVTAWIIIEDGQPHSARFGDLAGVDALRKLLTVREAEYCLEPPGPDFPGCERDFHAAMVKILIEAQRRIDEREAAKG